MLNNLDAALKQCPLTQRSGGYERNSSFYQHANPSLFGSSSPPITTGCYHRENTKTRRHFTRYLRAVAVKKQFVVFTDEGLRSLFLLFRYGS